MHPEVIHFEGMQRANQTAFLLPLDFLTVKLLSLVMHSADRLNIEVAGDSEAVGRCICTAC